MKPEGWYTGIVSLEDVAKNYKNNRNSGIYVLLDDSIKTSLIRNAEKKFGSRAKAEKSVGSFIRHMSEKNERYKVNLLNLMELCKTLEVDFKGAKIKAISTKNGAWGALTNSLLMPNLPFNFVSNSGVRIISSILHDGGITSELATHFTSGYAYFRKFFIENFRNVFGSIKNESSNPKKYECVFLPKVVGIILVYGLGLEYGKKVKTNPQIPDFIFNLKPELKWAFISQAIDEDGSIEKCAKRIQIMHAVETYGKNSKPPNLISDTKKLIESLNVDVTEPYLQSSYKVDGIKRERWAIRIRQRDLKSSWKNLDLKLHYKNQTLNSMFH